MGDQIDPGFHSRPESLLSASYIYLAPLSIGGVVGQIVLHGCYHSSCVFDFDGFLLCAVLSVVSVAGRRGRTANKVKGDVSSKRGAAVCVAYRAHSAPAMVHAWGARGFHRSSVPEAVFDYHNDNVRG